MSLTLARAHVILNGVFAKAAELRLRPLGAAVVDSGGHIIAAQRQDGAASLRPAIAIANSAISAWALGAKSSRREPGSSSSRLASSST